MWLSRVVITLYPWENQANLTSITNAEGLIPQIVIIFRITNSIETALDVTMSFTTLYFKLTDGSIHSFEHFYDNDIDFSSAERMTEPNAQEVFDNIKVSYANEHCKLN